MIALLAKKFVSNADQLSDPKVREDYGTLCGLVGIVLNLLLVAGKLVAGTVSGSIAMTADALNNLSDAGSSLVTLLGFRLAGRKADADHPFGHGRIEYLAGLVVAAAVLLTGVELARSSFRKILHPEDIAFSWLSVGILAAAILVKLYMWSYNHRIGRKLRSGAMEATATDCISDSLATGAVLLCTLIFRWTGLRLDGWCGAAVACMVIWAGIKAARDTVGPLLGEKTDPELAERIRATVLAYPEVLGVHDMIVHDYGPGRLIVSLHAEVPSTGDIMALHDTIDNAERELQRTFGCQAVIHMDPIVVDDAETSVLRAMVGELAGQIDPRASVHDFRMVTGPTHTNLIFDLVLPFGLPISDQEAVKTLRERISQKDARYFSVITVDKESL